MSREDFLSWKKLGAGWILFVSFKNLILRNNLSFVFYLHQKKLIYFELYTLLERVKVLKNTSNFSLSFSLFPQAFVLLIFGILVGNFSLALIIFNWINK